MLYDLLKSRRSIRKYKDQPVEKEKVDAILKCALLSPSSRGRRPWEFLVVEDRQLLEKLAESKQHGSAFLAGAPLGVVVLADPEVCDVWVEDTAIASTIMQLAAEELGLGSCWIQIRKRMHNAEVTAEAYVKEVLDIPDKYAALCIMAFGYPAESKAPYGEEDLPTGKIHHGSFRKQS